MNIKVVFLCAAFAVLIFGGINTDAKLAERKPKPLDIKTPLVTLENAYDKFINNFNLLNIISLVFEILNSCLLPLLNPATSALSNNIGGNYSQQLTDSQLQLITEAISHLQIASRTQNPIEFCSITGFEAIHTFIWVTDDQLTDFVHFFGKFGYGEIYKAIDDLYTQAKCPEELKDDLPKPIQSDLGTAKRFNDYANLPNVREQILQSRTTPLEGPTCDIMGIIVKLLDTGLVELLQLIETTTHQFNTNPSLHFLVGKLQEPIKGKSMREFRFLPEIQDLLKKAHEAIKVDPIWSEVFAIIKQVFGLDFFVINPYDVIFSVFEFLVWGTPFPSPTV